MKYFLYGFITMVILGVLIGCEQTPPEPYFDIHSVADYQRCINIGSHAVYTDMDAEFLEQRCEKLLKQ